MLRRLVVGAAATRPPAAALRRMLHTSGGSGMTESMAYRMSMLRAPSVVAKRDLTRNSCSLIGRLVAPVRPRHCSSDEAPRAYTFLSVAPSSSGPSSSSSGFKVTLKLKGELASVSLKHLKINDLVYVSGFLCSYDNVSSSGERYIMYQVFVNELNYVLDPSLPTTYMTSRMQKENEYIDRLRLWQLFFANPYEWWDNRESKPNVNYPDFKHKDTREKIWIHPDDPPWVRKQLELHDLKLTKIGHPSKNHAWKAQDFDYSSGDELEHSAEA